jgi:hypothetical protein
VVYLRDFPARLERDTKPRKVSEAEAIREMREQIPDPEYDGEISASRWLATLGRRDLPPRLPVWLVTAEDVPAYRSESSLKVSDLPGEILGRHVLLLDATTGDVVFAFTQAPGPLFAPGPPCKGCQVESWVPLGATDVCREKAMRHPGGGSSVIEDGVEPTLANLSDYMPLILLATVEGERRSRWNTSDGCPDASLERGARTPIVTPVRLRVERALVRKLEAPPDAEYVRWGGRVGRYSFLARPGPLAPGRYILFVEPFRPRDNPTGHMLLRVQTAFPVRDGRVIERGASRGLPSQNEPPLREVSYPLEEAIRIIQEHGRRWGSAAQPGPPVDSGAG